MKNQIPTSIPALVAASYKAVGGAGLHGAALPLLQNTQTMMNAELLALVDSINAYGSGKTELSTRRETLRSKVDTSRTFLMLGRDNFKPTLGTEYSQAWDNTGLIGSLMIPRTADEIVPVLAKFKGFLAANPDMEVAGRDITAAQAQLLLDDLTAAVTAFNQQDTIVGDLMEARDGKAEVMSKRLSDLVMELRMRLGTMDNRWLSFGFNRPGAAETPDQVEHVVAALIGPTAAALKWNAAARADYYHVFKKVIGTDTDYVLVGSPADLDFTLENLPAGATVQIVVTAVNSGGESTLSEIATITTH